MSNDDIRRRLCGSRHHWETILYSVSTARAWSVARANFVVILFYCQPNSIWSKYYLANTQILFGHLTKRSMSNLCVLPFPKQTNDTLTRVYIIWQVFGIHGKKCHWVGIEDGTSNASRWNTTMGDILITKLNTAFGFTALWRFSHFT